MELLFIYKSITKNLYFMGVKCFKYVLEMPIENLILPEQEVLQELFLLYKHLMETQHRLRKAKILRKSKFFLKSVFGTSMVFFAFKHVTSIYVNYHSSTNATLTNITV